MRVNIITDSASDITPEQARQMDVSVLPMTVRMDGKEYLDGVTLSREEFYARLPLCKTLPTTSQITPHAFEEAFSAPGAEEEAVVITISGKLSGTAQSALLAAKEHGGRIHVVDSLSACAGERVLVDYAVRLRGQGMGAEEIARELLRARERMCLVALVDTLEYVIKGGRMSRVAGVAGTMLRVRPVVGFRAGELTLLGKAIGAKKSNNLLTQIVHARGGIDFSMPLMLAYSGQSDEKLREYIDNSRELWAEKIDSLPISIIGSTVGAYAGPGAVALAFFANA